MYAFTSTACAVLLSAYPIRFFAIAAPIAAPTPPSPPPPTPTAIETILAVSCEVVPALIETLPPAVTVLSVM